YALKCAQDPKPPECGTTPGVLWEKTVQDFSTGSTGSSQFDFNGDGIPEVIYRDECWLRVYESTSGKTLFATTVTSGTAQEYAVVADVDADGHADLVVPADNATNTGCSTAPEPDTGALWTGPKSGVFVYRDPLNRWMPSRPIWNQHAYHITNVNMDGSVPVVETANWKTFNNYRKNTQGGPKDPAPRLDLSARLALAPTGTCSAGFTLS